MFRCELYLHTQSILLIELMWQILLSIHSDLLYLSRRFVFIVLSMNVLINYFSPPEL